MKKKESIFFAVPELIGFSVFYALSVFILLGYAGIFSGTLGHNLVAVGKNEAYHLAFANTIKFQILVVLIVFILSLILEIVIYDMRWDIWNVLFLLPLTMPANAVSAIWKVIFSKYGMLNAFLYSLGVEPVDFFAGPGSFWLLVLTFVWKNLGFAMLIWRIGLDMIPKNIYEAAALDGATFKQRIFYMTLPNLKNVSLILVIMLIVNSFKVFRESYLIAGNYPDREIYMLQNIFNNWLSKLELSRLAVGALYYLFFGVGVYAIVFLLGRRKKRYEKDM